MRNLVGRLIGCERGNALLVSVATIPLLISAAALAYDTVQLGLWTRQLQQAADAGAQAGANALAAGEPVRRAVERAVARDGRLRIIGPARIERRHRTIHVVLTSQKSLLVLGALLEERPTRSARATATVVPGDHREQGVSYLL